MVDKRNSFLFFYKIILLMGFLFIKFSRRFKILARLFFFPGIYNILNLYYFRNFIQRIYLRLNCFVVVNINRFL